MTFDDFIRLVLSVFPNASVMEDNEGQLIVYTNKIRLYHLTREESDEIVDIPENWEDIKEELNDA